MQLRRRECECLVINLNGGGDLHVNVIIIDTGWLRSRLNL